MENMKHELDIQFFAEEKETLAKEDPKSFEDVLEENPDYAKSMDDMITARLDKQAEELKAANSLELDKAKELAKLNDEERYAVELEERETALAEREKEIERHTLRTEASKMLQERSLPTDLADFVSYGSAEEISKSVKALGTLVEDEVSRRVKDIAKGGTVPGSGAKTDSREETLKTRNKKWEKRFNL